MSKSIKLQENTFIDSIGVSHNRKSLKEYLTKISSCGMITRFSNLEFDDGDSTWQIHDITFDREYSWNGNGYLIDDGNGKSISIGNNVELVEVSGWISPQFASKNTAIEFYIRKNGENILCAFTPLDAGWGTKTLAIPPTAVYVSPGDKISMTYVSTDGGKTILYASENRPTIALKVKVIK